MKSWNAWGDKDLDQMWDLEEMEKSSHGTNEMNAVGEDGIVTGVIGLY